MEAIVQEATNEDLARAADANLAALFRAMAQSLGGELARGDRVSRHLAFPTNPMFKGVWGSRFADADVERTIDETIDWFRSRGAPFFFWWTGPDTEPADLGARLERRGLLSMEGQQAVLAHGIKQTAAGAPVMATELSALDEAVLDRVPAGFSIHEVADDTDLSEFKRVFVETYGIPDWAGQAWVDATKAIGIGKTPWRMYVGRLEGEAVATNMLFHGGGYASIYAVATSPRAQGKGIGAAISLMPLLAARDAGYRYGVLFSTEMGLRVYERIGFRDTGARVNRYLWRAG